MINPTKYLLLLAMVVGMTAVRGSDSLKVNRFNSFRVNELLNNWSESANPTGLIYNQVNNLAGFDYRYGNGSGDLKRVMEPSDTRKHEIVTTSLRKLRNVFLEGGFSYANSWEKGGRWNGTFDPYRGNPYILGDSVTSAIYRKELYNLKGSLVSALSRQLTAGIKVDYQVGVGAKQKDPRPENTVMQLTINPGLIWHRPNYNLGLDIGVLQRKEEISYMQHITENSDISYFAFKGFGFYYKEISMNYFRFQRQNKLFGGIQFEPTKLKFKSLSEIRFQYGRERVEDGSSVIIRDRGGDWDILDVSLRETVRLGSPDRISKIVLFAGYFSGDGTEYTQQKVYKGNLVDYVTVGTNLKMNRTTYFGQLRYQWQTMKQRSLPDWLLQAEINGIHNSETYYYIPEIFTSSYTNVTGRVTFEKNFYGKKIHVAPYLSAFYVGNLSKSLNLSTLDEITKKENKEIYTADFDYDSLDKLGLLARLTCGFYPRNQKYINQLFISLDYNHMKSGSGSTGYSLLSARLGFMF